MKEDSKGLVQIAVTLRHNVVLDSDVELARREFGALVGGTQIVDLDSWEAVMQSPFGQLPAALKNRVQSVVRQSGRIGFVAHADPLSVRTLIRRSAFLQDIAIFDTSDATASDLKLVRRVAPSILVAVTVASLCEYASRLIFEPLRELPARLRALLDYLMTGQAGRFQNQVEVAIAAKKTTLSLTHDLHIYKAKFFPRLVRSLINIFGPESEGCMIDPFCGSGTSLLEGSLLGLSSIGVDVDPIAALISNSKVEPFTRSRRSTRDLLERLREFALNKMDGGSLFSSADRFDSTTISPLSDELMDKLRRRDSHDSTDYLSEIQRDLGLLTQLRDKYSRGRVGLLEVLLSDAVSKKIRYRYVGVGNGRYTIGVVRQSVADRFVEKLTTCIGLCDVFEWLEVDCGQQFAPTVAFQGDARSFVLPDGWQLADVCITSPPYLPASSGREHYASSRSLALALTKLAGAWEASRNLFVGEVEKGAFDRSEISQLTPTARTLLRYLMSDEGRIDPQRDPMRFERKALPTFRYLIQIEEFLRNLKHLVNRDGVCLLVVASQHIFYSHRRQELLKDGGLNTAESIEHTVRGNDLYGELAARAGWQLDEELELRLAKSATTLARPRASDEYSESVLVLRPSARF